MALYKAQNAQWFWNVFWGSVLEIFLKVSCWLSSVGSTYCIKMEKKNPAYLSVIIKQKNLTKNRNISCKITKIFSTLRCGGQWGINKVCKIQKYKYFTFINQQEFEY